MKSKHTKITEEPLRKGENPYKELLSYEEEDRDKFFGREEETEKLLKLVGYNALTVVHGKSGIGKTSLLNAGLFPRLREENFRPIRIRLNFSENQPPLKEQIQKAIEEGLGPNENDKNKVGKVEIESQIDGVPGDPIAADETLWAYFRRVNHFKRTEKGEKKNVTPVLIFDPFEEIFTVGKHHDDKDKIIDELYWLLGDQLPPDIKERIPKDDKVAKKLAYSDVKPHFKVILSLREDYLPHLNGLRKGILLKDRALFWINHLNGKQARDIISKPENGFKDEEKINNILYLFYPKEKVGKKIVPEEKMEIEPAFLSLTCHQIFEKGLFESITSEQLGILLEDYYDSKMKEYPQEVPKFIESQLLTEAGYRTHCNLEEAQSLKGFIDKLIRQRLLRRFHDGHNEYVEIVHDFLVPIILERRSRRLQRKRNWSTFFFGMLSLIFLLLAVIAFYQGDRANKQRNIAQVNRLTSEALLKSSTDNTKALRIAAEAIKKAEYEQEPRVFRTLSEIGYSSNNRPFYINITPLKPNDVIYSAAFSADSKHILTAHEDGKVYIRDLEGNSLVQLKGHSGRVMSAVFSPDEKLVLSGSWDKTARLWTREGKLLKIFNHDGPITSVSFSPDGKRILTSSFDNTARLWDINGDQIQIFRHNAKVISAEFSPEGNRILTTSWDNIARIWNDKTEVLSEFDHKRSILSALFSPDGEFLLIAGVDGTVELWDLENKELKTSIKHEGVLSKVAFTPEGDGILTASEDGAILMWDLQGNQRAQFDRHGKKITAIAISPDEHFLFTSSDGEFAVLWDLQSNIVVDLEHPEEVSDITFSSDGSSVLTITRDGIGRLGNAEGKFMASFKHERGKIIKALFSPKMDFILTLSNDGVIKRWDPRGKFIDNLKLYGIQPTDFLFSREGDKILTLFRSGSAFLLTLGGEIVKELKHETTICRAEFSPSGKELVLTVSCADGVVKLWDFNDTPPVSFKQENIASAVFSQDASLILIASKTGEIIVGDLSGKILHQLKLPIENKELISAELTTEGNRVLTVLNDAEVVTLWNFKGIPLVNFNHDQRIYTASLSPDGKQVLTASLDKKANLWDLSGNLLTTFNHDTAVFFAGFSPDGKRVATICRDNTVRIWLTPQGILQWLENSKIPELSEKEKRELGIPPN